jgi:hypothetical protein
VTGGSRMQHRSRLPPPIPGMPGGPAFTRQAQGCSRAGRPACAPVLAHAVPHSSVEHPTEAWEEVGAVQELAVGHKLLLRSGRRAGPEERVRVGYTRTRPGLTTPGQARLDNA